LKINTKPNQFPHQTTQEKQTVKKIFTTFFQIAGIQKISIVCHAINKLIITSFSLQLTIRIPKKLNKRNVK
jgi:hypothetical protein